MIINYLIVTFRNLLKILHINYSVFREFAGFITEAW